jgi:hypothetical protein
MSRPARVLTRSEDRKGLEQEAIASASCCRRCSPYRTESRMGKPWLRFLLRR